MKIRKVIPEPKRVLQLFNENVQSQFKNWTAKDKLEWLESINLFYWKAHLNQKKAL